MATTLKFPPRWVLSKDLDDMVEVERCSFTSPWPREVFLTCLKRKQANGLVIEVRGRVVAFLLFEVFRKRVQILNMAVQANFRRQGLGQQLIETLLEGLIEKTNCARVVAELRETNLAAQLFLKVCGFTATCVMRAYYEDTDEDAFQFEHALVRQAEKSALLM